MQLLSDHNTTKKEKKLPAVLAKPVIKYTVTQNTTVYRTRSGFGVGEVG